MHNGSVFTLNYSGNGGFYLCDSLAKFCEEILNEKLASSAQNKSRMLSYNLHSLMLALNFQIYLKLSRIWEMTSNLMLAPSNFAMALVNLGLLWMKFGLWPRFYHFYTNSLYMYRFRDMKLEYVISLIE